MMSTGTVRPRSRRTFRSLSPSLPGDRKSTRLNSSHGYISYAVFCLKKKKNTYMDIEGDAPQCLVWMYFPIFTTSTVACCDPPRVVHTYRSPCAAASVYLTQDECLCDL